MKVFIGTFLVLIVASLGGSEEIPFASERWQIKAEEHRIEEYLGRQSLFMRGGIALVKDAEFLNGVIEYEVAFAQARGFAGAVWRVQDDANYEQFYMRSHQSGNPDANQYTPCFNGLTGWQLYHGEGYGVPVSYAFDSWIPVRIVVSEGQAEVFIGDLTAPALFVDELKRKPETGPVGLTVANFGPAHFSNFRYRTEDEVELIGRVKRDRSARTGSVMNWQVSTTFSEADLADLKKLPPNLLKTLEWAELESETSGLLNISRLRTLAPQQDTVFARVFMSAETAHDLLVDFGYSDRVRIYVNRHLVYSGNNGYRSRDYRYLGTIGFFDSVNLSLPEGENEILFAVSESFGGWGLQAATTPIPASSSESLR